MNIFILSSVACGWTVYRTHCCLSTGTVVTVTRHNVTCYVPLLTYCMLQCPSWEANWFAASQEIPRISRNPKVHYRTQKRPPPVKNKLRIKHPACECFLTKFFTGEGLLAPRPNPKLEDHPSSAVHDCLFNIFAAAVHIGGRSSIRNLRTRHAVVTDPLHGHTLLVFLNN